MPIGKIEVSGQLLLVSARGTIMTNEVVKVVNDFYPSGSVLDIIWDVSDCSLELINMQRLREIAGATLTATTSGARRGGKTAYVTSSRAKHTMLCTYKNITELAGIPVSYNIFRSLEETQRGISGL